jgi:hypothetical protein
MSIRYDSADYKNIDKNLQIAPINKGKTWHYKTLNFNGLKTYQSGFVSMFDVVPAL